jgi:hypothetical protein
MLGQQALFTLPECGHEYHTPCFLTYANMETEARKALKCCICNTPIGKAAGKELEQLTLDAVTQASNHHQPSKVPAPIAVTSAFDVSAYYQGSGSAKIAPTLGQAKAAPSSSGNVKSAKQKLVKNSSAMQQLVQAT